MSEQELQTNKENSNQKLSLKNSSFFDQLKNANFSDLSSIVRNYKANNVLQQSNSPDIQNPNKSQSGKENNTTAQTKNQYQQQQQQKSIHISQILEMTICKQQKFIDFGSSLPGYVLEEVLILRNLTSVPLTTRTTVLCFDDELNELDEYIFSVRSEENYDYNENIISKIQPNESVKLFLALKAPNLRNERVIEGNVSVKICGASCVNGLLEKEIQACVKIPKVVCLKELFSTDYQRQVIKLAMKMANGKADCKVPFKNQMPFTVKAEFELIQEKKSNDEQQQQYEFSVNPEFGILQPNQMAMVVIVGKKNEVRMSSNSSSNRQRDGFKYALANQLEKMLASKRKKSEKEKSERNVLLLVKIVHSTVILCFPTIIEIY